MQGTRRQPRRDAVVFAVHLWNPGAPEPETIWQVMNRQKDIQYTGRALSHIQRQRQLHRLRHVVRDLSMHLPAELRAQPEIRELESYGCATRMHVVRLFAPSLRGEDHQKDIGFSQAGIRARSDAGYADTAHMLGPRDRTDPNPGDIYQTVGRRRTRRGSGA